MLPEFLQTVKFNCDVSDANYWGYFSICTLLLRLRELFKVERCLDPWDSIDRNEITPWIEKKETIWKELENAQLKKIKLDENLYSPFDTTEINNKIVKRGFVYGAGYALFMKPSFFVGLIDRFEEIDRYKIYFIDREIVRDIFSSPGMTIGKTIYIRLTDIKYRLWENLHSWKTKKELIFDFLLSEYGTPEEWYHPFEEFKEIVDKYSKIVLYHEIAEQEESLPAWNEIIRQCITPKTEHILRGIRDFLADLSQKGPIFKATIEKDKSLLSLYIVFQGVYQKRILKHFLSRLQNAMMTDNWSKIEEIRENEFKKWKSIYNQIIESFELYGFEAVKNLVDKIFEVN